MDTIYGKDLYHYGIDGQRWGFRRFQNEDGTYTEEGKKRRRQYEERMNRAFKDQIKQGKDKPSVSRAEKIAKSSSDIAEKSSKIVRRYSKKNDSLKEISDSELRNLVNRLQLEKQYSDLSASEISNGKKKVLDTLDTIGDIASIGISIATIYSMAKQIKG